ncbi:MAG: DinB family protein [Vicinamibacteraceae bacterium]
MAGANDAVLDALLDSWDRNNTILVNLLRAIPEGAMDIRATGSSPSIGQMFMHMHYVRLIFVHEDAPEFSTDLPKHEWIAERDRDRMAEMLSDSARAVRGAVHGKLTSGREMDLHYDHPMLLLQHMVWHEGYHHGQIKLALKLAGHPFDDEEIGAVTWDVWMKKAPRG